MLLKAVLRSRSRHFLGEAGADFWLAGAAFFKAAPVASLWQAKNKILAVVTEHNLRAIYNGKCDP